MSDNPPSYYIALQTFSLPAYSESDQTPEYAETDVITAREFQDLDPPLSEWRSPTRANQLLQLPQTRTNQLSRRRRAQAQQIKDHPDCCLPFCCILFLAVIAIILIVLVKSKWGCSDNLEDISVANQTLSHQ